MAIGAKTINISRMGDDDDDGRRRRRRRRWWNAFFVLSGLNCPLLVVGAHRSVEWYKYRLRRRQAIFLRSGRQKLPLLLLAQQLGNWFLLLSISDRAVDIDTADHTMKVSLRSWVSKPSSKDKRSNYCCINWTKRCAVIGFLISVLGSHITITIYWTRHGPLCISGSGWLLYSGFFRYSKARHRMTYVRRA